MNVTTMNIWILDCDVDHYENLAWGEDINLDVIQSFDGRSMKADYKPLSVRRMYHRAFSNTPGLSPHIPVFDHHAVQVLGALIKKDAEFLPLECPDGQFYAVNVTNVVDGIDYTKAEYKTFRDGKRVMRYTKYAFVTDKIKNADIFRIPDLPLTRPFVSDRFKELVDRSDLIGFLFEPAWSSSEDAL